MFKILEKIAYRIGKYELIYEHPPYVPFPLESYIYRWPLSTIGVQLYNLSDITVLIYIVIWLLYANFFSLAFLLPGPGEAIRLSNFDPYWRGPLGPWEYQHGAQERSIGRNELLGRNFTGICRVLGVQHPVSGIDKAQACRPGALNGHKKN